MIYIHDTSNTLGRLRAPGPRESGNHSINQSSPEFYAENLPNGKYDDSNGFLTLLLGFWTDFREARFDLVRTSQNSHNHTSTAPKSINITIHITFLHRKMAAPNIDSLMFAVSDARLHLLEVTEEAVEIGAITHDPAMGYHRVTVDDVNDEDDPSMHPSRKLKAIMAVNSAKQALQKALRELEMHIEVTQRCAADNERIQAEVAKAFNIKKLVDMQRRALEIVADEDAARERLRQFTAARATLLAASATGTQPINAASEMVRLGQEIVWVAGEIRALEDALAQQHRAIEAQMQLVPIDEAIAAGFRVGIARTA